MHPDDPKIPLGTLWVIDLAKNTWTQAASGPKAHPGFDDVRPQIESCDYPHLQQPVGVSAVRPMRFLQNDLDETLRLEWGARMLHRLPLAALALSVVSVTIAQDAKPAKPTSPK